MRVYSTTCCLSSLPPPHRTSSDPAADRGHSPSALAHATCTGRRVNRRHSANTHFYVDRFAGLRTAGGVFPECKASHGEREHPMTRTERSGRNRCHFRRFRQAPAKIRPRRCAAAVAAAVAGTGCLLPATASAAVATTTISIQDLGSLGGTSEALAVARVNGVPWAVGDSVNAYGVPHAFLWVGPSPAQLIDLGTLHTTSPSATRSSASGVDEAGHIVGWSDSSPCVKSRGQTNCPGPMHAVEWNVTLNGTPSIQIVDLGPAEGMYNRISPNGRFINGSHNNEALIWADSATSAQLLPRTGTSANTTGVSDAGTVVGSENYADGWHAARWDSTTTSSVELNTSLPGAVDNQSGAFDVSPSGVVCGWAQHVAQQSIYPVAWTPDNTGHVLGNGTPGYAEGIDPTASRIVGFVGTTSFRAVLWLPQNGWTSPAVDLTNAVSAAQPTSRWSVLDRAYGVDAEGDVVGFGQDAHNSRAFLITGT